MTSLTLQKVKPTEIQLNLVSRLLLQLRLNKYLITNDRIPDCFFLILIIEWNNEPIKLYSLQQSLTVARPTMQKEFPNNCSNNWPFVLPSASALSQQSISSTSGRATVHFSPYSIDRSICIGTFPKNWHHQSAGGAPHSSSAVRTDRRQQRWTWRHTPALVNWSERR